MGCLMDKYEGDYRGWIPCIGNLLRRVRAHVTRTMDPSPRSDATRQGPSCAFVEKTPGPTTPAPTPELILAPQDAERTTTRRMERQETHHSPAGPLPSSCAQACYNVNRRPMHQHNQLVLHVNTRPMDFTIGSSLT